MVKFLLAVELLAREVGGAPDDPREVAQPGHVRRQGRQQRPVSVATTRRVDALLRAWECIRPVRFNMSILVSFYGHGGISRPYFSRLADLPEPRIGFGKSADRSRRICQNGNSVLANPRTFLIVNVQKKDLPKFQIAEFNFVASKLI